MYKIEIFMKKPDKLTVQEITSAINRELTRFTGTNTIVVVKDNVSLNYRDRTVKEGKK